MRKFDGSVQQVSLQRPVRVVQSPVSARLETGSGGERLGVIKLSSFNARAQVGRGTRFNNTMQAGVLARLRFIGVPAKPPHSSSICCSICNPQRDTLAAVQRLQAAGADRLVLDLRDNRGGLVTEGIEVRGSSGCAGH